MDTILYNIHGQVFYNSKTHIHGDTRIKTRCDGRNYVWQYRDRQDKDGIAFGACIGMDKQELEDLLNRGVKYYQCNYPAGNYKIEIEKIFEWGVPVVNRQGDREQICVSIRHWDFQPKGGVKKEKPIKVKLVKPKRVKAWQQRSFV
jgi:hypothetical protein